VICRWDIETAANILDSEPDDLLRVYGYEKHMLAGSAMHSLNVIGDEEEAQMVQGRAQRSLDKRAGL
jgi:hypothetical protein